jgi:hypothetical protein
MQIWWDHVVYVCGYIFLFLMVVAFLMACYCLAALSRKRELKQQRDMKVVPEAPGRPQAAWTNPSMRFTPPKKRKLNSK